MAMLTLSSLETRTIEDQLKKTCRVYCCSNHLSQWQMITQASKSLKVDIMWEVHKKTQQGVSAKLESYIYKICLVHATDN